MAKIPVSTEIWFFNYSTFLPRKHVHITSNNTLSALGKNNSLPKFLKLMRVFKSHTDAEIFSKCSKLGNKYFLKVRNTKNIKKPNSRTSGTFKGLEQFCGGLSGYVLWQSQNFVLTSIHQN